MARYSRPDGRDECHNEGRTGYAPLDFVSYGPAGEIDVHDRPVARARNASSAPRLSATPSTSRRPLIAHANGLHFLIETLLRQQHAIAGSVGAESIASRLWPPSPVLLQHAVLLIDPAAAAAAESGGDRARAGEISTALRCNVSTLGDILPASARRMSLSWLAQQEKKKKKKKRSGPRRDGGRARDAGTGRDGGA